MRFWTAFLISLSMGTAIFATQSPKPESRPESRPESKPRLAILPLKEEGKNALGDVSDTLNTLVANAFVESGAFQLVERHQIQTMLAEAKYQHSGMVDESTAAELGKHLGVNYVLVGSYLAEKGSSDKQSVTLSLRLVDVGNATVHKSFLETAEGDTLGQVFTKLSASLMEKASALRATDVTNPGSHKIAKALVILTPGSVTCAKKAQTHAEPVKLSFFNEKLEDYAFLMTEVGRLFPPEIKVVYESSVSNVHTLLEKHRPDAIVLITFDRTGKVHTFSQESEHRAEVRVQFVDPKNLSIIGVKTIATDLINGKLYEVFPVIKEQLTKRIARDVPPLPYEM